MKRRTYLRDLASGAGVFALAGNALGTTGGRGPNGVPPGGSLDDADRETITNVLESHVDGGTFPGAAVAVVGESDVLYQGAVGNAQIDPVTRDLSTDTVFDLASMTKAVATTTAVLQLVERGQLGLQETLCDIFDESLDGEKCSITVEHLLTHTSGYPAWAPLWVDVDHPEEVVEYLLQDVSLAAEPGTEVGYSDLGFILLGAIVDRASGTPLDEYVAEQVFDPLGMETTAFNPLETLSDGLEYAATERSAYYGEVVVGEVHDENAAFRGGVSGHAGLFSTIDDLSTFAQALLGGGQVDGTRILSRPTVNRMTRNRTANLDGSRGLGWGLSNLFGESESGAPYDNRAFGQTGFTGTSIWFSPRMDLSVVALTNRVHPSRDNLKILEFRPEFHNLVASLVSS